MTINSPLIKKALYFSAENHDGQYRKGGSVPYIVHPVLVAWGVGKYTDNEEVIAAALLHDTLEDCPNVSSSLLQKEFGDYITNLVEEVSFLEIDKKEASSWREKKEKYLERLASTSNDALLIVAADKMTNMYAYFEALQSGFDMSTLPFGGTPPEYRWYYGEVAIILRNKLKDSKITRDYTEMLALYM